MRQIPRVKRRGFCFFSAGLCSNGLMANLKTLKLMDSYSYRPPHSAWLSMLTATSPAVLQKRWQSGLEDNCSRSAGFAPSIIGQPMETCPVDLLRPSQRRGRVTKLLALRINSISKPQNYKPMSVYLGLPRN